MSANASMTSSAVEESQISNTKEDLVEQALQFAEKRHRHHYRNDGKTPYVEHPKAVMKIVRDEFHEDDPGILAAALLHDTIEDTGTDFDEIAGEFGKRVARLVAVLSKDNRLPKGEREREYFGALEDAPKDAKLIKVADLLHNLRDAAADDRKEKARKAKKLIKRFGSGARLKEPITILKAEIER